MDGRELRLVQLRAAPQPLEPPAAAGRTWTVSVYPPLRSGGPWWACAIEVDHGEADDVLALSTAASGEGGNAHAAALSALASAVPGPTR